MGELEKSFSDFHNISLKYDMWGVLYQIHCVLENNSKMAFGYPGRLSTHLNSIFLKTFSNNSSSSLVYTQISVLRKRVNRIRVPFLSRRSHTICMWKGDYGCIDLVRCLCWHDARQKLPKLPKSRLPDTQKYLFPQTMQGGHTTMYRPHTK